jgi:RNase P/RNase MRP subunit p29
MTVLHGAVDATFAAFGIDALYTPAGGEPIAARVIAKRPDTIVGFGETRIHTETATFEVRASDVANPRPGDQITVSGEILLVQGEPERRDPDRLVWTMDAGTHVSGS